MSGRTLLAACSCAFVAALGCGQAPSSPPAPTPDVVAPTGLDLSDLPPMGVDAETVSPQARRTMEVLHAIGQAVERYYGSADAYPRADSIDELARLLEPRHLESVPRVDGWGHELVVWSDEGMLEIRSLGSDGEVEETPAWGARSDEAADVIYADGGFAQWPEGTLP